ncbi:hypothetical protein TNCV_1928131 [Trichonephila clavipes]|nr:hypothetical protein TNCV_1928131 [Trichonephila clavipes]
MRVNFNDARAPRHGCDPYRDGGEYALSRNIQNRTDHFRLRNSQKNISLHFPEEWSTQNGIDHSSLPNFPKKYFPSLPRRRGYPGLNRRSLDLQTNSLLLSYTPRVSEPLLCVP